MIKENELRIGNFISDANASDSFFAKVKKLDYSRCYYGQFHSAYSDLKPIPITPEWLIKFGFIYDEYSLSSLVMMDTYSKNRKLELAFEEGEIKSVYVGIQKIDDGKRINYVHQLQNLYFALTGEELEFNQH